VVAAVGVGALAIIVLRVRRRVTTNATRESYNSARERLGDTPTSSREPTERVQQRGEESIEETLAQDTQKADGSIREDIANIIRESIKRSQIGYKEPPQYERPTPKTRAVAQELPIEGYDSLDTSQIARRLERLVVEEIELLRDYEVENQNRQSLIARFERRIKERPGEDMRILRESLGRSGRGYRNR
jgi:hypothetical protein